MKHIFYVIILLIAMIECSNNSNTYNYIKIFSITKADTITDLNKGLKIHNFLYYDPDKDSVIFRIMQSLNPDSFNTYQGYFRNKNYSDTIAMVISYLRHYIKGSPQYEEDRNIMYSGPLFYVEYSDTKGLHFNEFICTNDTTSNFNNFFNNIENLPWKKALTNNNIIDETDEVVKMLKGLGAYDRLVKPYVPLPCETGIILNKLYGSWRTIGDEYNDATYNYWINEIDSKGIWIIDRVIDGKRTLKYIGNIKAINNNEIKVQSENQLTTLEILNLTENCFEYRHKQSKQVTRLDRMK